MKLRTVVGHTVHGDEIIDYVPWPADKPVPPGAYRVVLDSVDDFMLYYGSRLDLDTSYIDGTCSDVKSDKRVVEGPEGWRG